MILAQQTLWFSLLLVVCTLAKDLEGNIRINNNDRLRRVKSASIRLTTPSEDANRKNQDAVRILQGGHDHGENANSLSCNGHGTYITSTGSCKCSEGYYGDKCGMAQVLISTDLVSRSVSGDDGEIVFYYPLTDPSKAIDILLQKDLADLTLSVCASQDGTCTRNEDLYFGSLITSLVIEIDTDYITTFNGYNLRITIINSDSNASSVSAQVVEVLSSSSSSKLFILYIVISVAGFLLVLLTIFLVIRYRRHKQRLQELALRGGPVGAEANVDQQQRPAQQNASNVVLLTREEFIKYFPKRKFENFKSSFPQASCSICLDDFTAEIPCRQLYCEHLFHSRCIGSWLSTHDSCPNCKKEMTKVAINEFLTSQLKVNTRIVEDVLQQNPVGSDEEQESLVEVSHPREQNALKVEIRPSPQYRLSEVQIEIQNRRSETQVPAQSQNDGNQEDRSPGAANRNDA